MKYRLLQDVIWCGFKILSEGQIVYESSHKQPDHISPDEIVICVDPVTGSKQTVVPRSYLAKID